jgi:hypothetical protein
VLEVACDESGYEGEKLIGTTTDVFAHASVALDIASATACMRELRRRIRSPAVEYKAGHLLREKHRPVLEWLLGPSGPIHGYAHVFLIDKVFYVLHKLTGVQATARTLYREGPHMFGRDQWESFLVAANALVRTRDRSDPLARTIDPLIPAIVRAVAYWSIDTQPVAIVHDQQTTLSKVRIEHLTDLPASLSLVDSGTDFRVQVADIVAGTARKIASDELNGRGDATFTALLRPYVDPLSIWGDDRSWSLLSPDQNRRSR